MDKDMAVLRDERDLLWLAVGPIQRIGSDCVFDVHFLARSEPDEPLEPFLVGRGYREPAEGLRHLVDGLAGAVLGEVRALRHDPVRDGLSFEFKVEGGSELRGFEVVVWLDMTRTSRAMKAWATAGRQQAGLRFHTTVERVEDFRAALYRLAFPAPEA